MKNLKRDFWPKFDDLFPEFGAKGPFAVSFEDCDVSSDSTESNVADTDTLTPWLTDRGKLLLVRSPESRFMDAMLYHVAASAAEKGAVRLFLTKRDRAKFLMDFVKYLTQYDSVYGAEDLRERYERAKQKIAEMDLDIQEMTGYPIEDVEQMVDKMNLYGSVMIFDSLMSLKSKAADQWMLSRGIIGARLREYLEDYIGVRSIVVFEQAFPGIDYGETYASFDSYLDGSLYMYHNDGRRVDNDAYWGVNININDCQMARGELFRAFNLRTNRFFNDWPKPVDPPCDSADLFDLNSDMLF